MFSEQISYGSHAYVCRIMYLAMLRFFSFNNKKSSQIENDYLVSDVVACEREERKKNPYTRKIVQVVGLEPTDQQQKIRINIEQFNLLFFLIRQHSCYLFIF